MMNPTNNPLDNNINKRALLARLNISVWTPRKKDAAAGREVARNNNADSGTVDAFVKLIEREHTSLALVQTIASRARAIQAKYCLPFEKGSWVITAPALFPYCGEQRTLKADFMAAAVQFAQHEYPTLAQHAPARLGALYDAKDFPADILSKFGFVYDDFRALPEGRHLSIVQADADLIGANELDARVNESIKQAQAQAWGRVIKPIQHMVTQLKKYDPDNKRGTAFRDTLVENIQEVLQLAPLWDVTGDPQYAAVLQDIRALTVHDCETLRVSATVRENTAAAAQALLDEIDSLLG